MKREAEMQLEKNKFGEKRKINRIKDGTAKKQIAMSHRRRVYRNKQRKKTDTEWTRTWTEWITNGLKVFAFDSNFNF